MPPRLLADGPPRRRAVGAGGFGGTDSSGPRASTTSDATRWGCSPADNRGSPGADCDPLVTAAKMPRRRRGARLTRRAAVARETPDSPAPPGRPPGRDCATFSNTWHRPPPYESYRRYGRSVALIVVIGKHPASSGSRRRPARGRGRSRSRQSQTRRTAPRGLRRGRWSSRTAPQQTPGGQQRIRQPTCRRITCLNSNPLSAGMLPTLTHDDPGDTGDRAEGGPLARGAARGRPVAAVLVPVVCPSLE